MKTKTSLKFFISLLILSLLSVNINLIGVLAAQDTHDVAVVKVTVNPERVGFGLDEIVNIMVVVANQGAENETFSVTVSYDNTVIGTKNVTNLAPSINTTLNFEWNTSNLAVGTYSINATASLVPNETDTTDNTVILKDEVSVVSPYMVILPRNTKNTTLTSGNYTISIYTNYNGSDIWGYQFILTYNPSVLYGIKVTNGDLITGANAKFIPGNFDNTIGQLGLTGAYGWDESTDPPTLVNFTGPGVLAYVTFTIVGEGESPIEFDIIESKLKRANGTNIIDSITHLRDDPTEGKFLDGSFKNVEEVLYDVAVIDINASPKNVTAGETVTINVTIKNKGNTIARVKVTVFWGYNPIIGPLYNIGELGDITIGIGETKIVSFEWDTTDTSEGSQPLTARIELLGSITDANMEDNELTIEDAVMVKAAVGTPIPILLLIAIAIVVIVAIVIIYIIIRKIRK
ncbi:hypothetical protein DRO69_03480 [Candidatus Bathyarchaeota archaeon]|nr:MAG: hypothetical protein DRO69_03480 [Candidatus Bathyarchaeota archaeon]